MVEKENKQRARETKPNGLGAAALIGFEYLAISKPGLAIEAAAAMLESASAEVRAAGLAMGRSAIVDSEGRGLRSNALAGLVSALLEQGSESDAIAFAKSAPEALGASAGRVLGALPSERAIALEEALPGIFTRLPAKLLRAAPECLGRWVEDGKISKKKCCDAAIEAGWAWLLAEREGRAKSSAAESARAFAVRIEKAAPGWMASFWKQVWQTDIELEKGSRRLNESLLVLALPSEIDPFDGLADRLAKSWKLRRRVVDAASRLGSLENAKRAGRALGAACVPGSVDLLAGAAEGQVLSAKKDAMADTAMVAPDALAYASMEPKNNTASMWLGWGAIRDGGARPGHRLAFAEGLMQAGAEAPKFGARTMAEMYYRGYCDLRAIGSCAWGMAMECSKEPEAANSPVVAWMLSGTDERIRDAERSAAMSWLAEIREGKRFGSHANAVENAGRLGSFIESVALSMEASAGIEQKPAKRKGL